MKKEATEAKGIDYEEKKSNYRECNIRMIERIKSEESQKRINMIVTLCYLQEGER